MPTLLSKKFLTIGLVATSLFLAGCLTDSEDNSLKITAHPQSVTGTLGDTVSFSVSASGTGPFHYLWVTTINGVSDTLADTTATVSLKLNSQLSGASLQVYVSNETETVPSSSAAITVTYAAGDTLSLGAQANLTLGSVLDLDSGKVWSSTTANANQSKIDLVYLYYNNAPSLNGARAARDSGIAYGNINLTNSYDTNQVKDIQMVKVSSMPASIAAAKSAYTGGVKVSSSPIEVGDKFVVLSTENIYHYLEIRSVSGTTAGTAGLTFFMGKLKD